MYELPIPLAGHCVVTVNNKYVVFLGGGIHSYFFFALFIPSFLFLKGTTKFREEDGSPLMFTGPVPTTHVHIYNLDTEAWTTTYMDQAGETLKMASIFRIKTRLAFNNVKPKAKDWYLVFD